jgi:hypothetical protein
MTFDGVLNWILSLLTTCRLLTTSNYNSLTEFHAPTITVATAHKVFTSRLLAMDFNSGDSSASAFTTLTKSSRHRLPYDSLCFN